jgi:ADP-heptose:LPS heptosyltransferase
MVDPRYVELLRQVRGLDVPVPVDPRRARAALLSTIRELREVGYTAVLDLQGLIKSAVLARAVGAWQTIGFPRAHLREPLARLLYTDTPDPGAHRHVVFKNLSLLAALGVRQAQPVFPIDVPDTPVLEEARRVVGGPSYALLNPGAGWPNKQWPAARFGALAAALRERAGLRSLVLWGPGEEALAEEVVAASGGAAVRSPATGIMDLFAIAKAARVIVSGDTGPLHIAASVGTPVVGLYGPTYAERNGPWAEADVTIARTDGCACLYRRRCQRGQPCIEEIGVDELVTAVRRRLEWERSRFVQPAPPGSAAGNRAPLGP